MNLDPKTVILFNAIGSLSISFGFYIISRGNLRQIWEIRSWALSTFIQSTGWIIIGVLRGIIPDFISIILGNGLLILSQAMTFNILCKFLNIKANRYYSYLVTGIATLFICYYQMFEPDFSKRSIALSISIALIQISSAFALLKPLSRHSVHYFISATYAICGISLIGRAVFYIIHSNPINSLFEQNLMQDIGYLIFFLTVMLLPFGFLLLCIDRYIVKKMQSDEKIQKLLMGVEQSPVSIVITNTKGEIEYVNPWFSEVTGYSREEVIGQNPRILKSGFTPHNEYVTIWEQIASGEKWKGIFHNKKKNGELYWESANISPIQNARGEITHYIGIKENITAQIAADKKIKESEEKYRLILQTSRDLIHILDLDGNLIEFNSAFLTHLGYTEEDVKNLNVNQWDAQWNQIELEKIIPDLIKNPKIFETVHKRKDGLLVNVEISATGIMIKDQFFLYAAARDITVRKKNELILTEIRKKLKDSNTTKDKFFSIIAHDLKGPIGNINSILEIVTSKENEISKQENDKFMSMLKISAKNVMSLLENLLTWSRSQRGDIDFNPKKYALNEIVNSNVSLFSSMAANKNILLKNSIEDKVSAFFDFEMMNTVFRNLISNAIKYTRENGEVNISAVETKDFTEFVVRDNGIGMSEVIRDGLFRLDVKQASIQGTKGEHGSRLGLILCKEFIDKHRGSITVKSKPNQGSEFLVRLYWNNHDEPRPQNLNSF